MIPEGSFVLINPDSKYASKWPGQLPLGVVGVASYHNENRLREYRYRVTWGDKSFNYYREVDLVPLIPAETDFTELL